MKLFLNLLVLLTFFGFSKPSVAETKEATEEHFQNLFITAGYSTAFGAALGAAILGLSERPGSKLRYIAVGASVGFIAGSLLGTCVIFYPAFSSGGRTNQASRALEVIPTKTNAVYISPIFDQSSNRLRTVQAAALLAEF